MNNGHDDKIKIKLRKIIDIALSKNLIIHGYGASTKGNVLLQYFNFNNKQIPFIADRNPAKYNKFTPGTKIKIISESDRIKIGIDNLNSILKNNLESHISEECIVKPFFASFYTISNGMGDGAENDTRIEVCFPKSIEFTFQINKNGDK